MAGAERRLGALGLVVLLLTPAAMAGFVVLALVLLVVSARLGTRFARLAASAGATERHEGPMEPT